MLSDELPALSTYDKEDTVHSNEPSDRVEFDLEYVKFQQHLSTLTPDEADDLRWEIYDRSQRAVAAGYELER